MVPDVVNLATPFQQWDRIPQDAPQPGFPPIKVGSEFPKGHGLTINQWKIPVFRRMARVLAHNCLLKGASTWGQPKIQGGIGKPGCPAHRRPKFGTNTKIPPPMPLVKVSGNNPGVPKWPPGPFPPEVSPWRPPFCSKNFGGPPIKEANRSPPKG